MRKKRKISFEYFYNAVIILLPVFSVYSIAGELIDFDVIAMASVLLMFFIKKHRVFWRCRWDVALLIVYTLAITIANVFVGPKFSDTTSIILRCGRYCLYLYLVFTVGKQYFSYEKAMRIYRVVVYLAFVYICLQAVAYYGFGVTLPSKIGAVSEAANAGQQVGRLRAFFTEPAALGYSIIPFIVCSLFGETYRPKKTGIIDAIVGSACIVLSTSSQGVLVIIVMWVIWFLSGVVSGRLKNKELLYFVIVLIVGAALYGTGLVSYSLERISGGIGKSDGAIAARTSGYVTLTLLSNLQKTFGVGYGNYIVRNIYGLKVPYLDVNYSSIAEHLFTTGIVGTLLLAVIFIKQFFTGGRLARAILLAFLILAIMGCPMSGKFFPIYVSFAFFGDSSAVKSDNVKKYNRSIDYYSKETGGEM